jgi:carbamoyl-phosphate synthase small subunit
VKAYLVLEDGRTFEGESWGATGETYGEIVFTTGMTGYQETMTDPSYCGQIVVMTSPHVGNTGVNLEDNESRKMWLSGFVVRDPSPSTSSWRAEGSLQDKMRRQGVVGIHGVDTRAITRHVRTRGAMKAGVFSGVETPTHEMVERVRSRPLTTNSTGVVSTKETYVVPTTTGAASYRVASLDFGVKSATPKKMASRGVESVVLSTAQNVPELLEQIKRINPDGLFMSNGPGDPASQGDIVGLVQEVLKERIPVFGICLGHQILGRALGLQTYKLKFGHRGINQPVLNRLTGRVEITAQNHGYALDVSERYFSTPFGQGEVTHVSLNDRTVEGIRLLDWPAFSVQYHPEAAAGPHDSSYLFDDFVEMMRVAKGSKRA